MDMGLGRLRQLLMDREAWSAAIHRTQRVGHDWATELNWTELDSKEIKSVNPKGNQSWIFIERTDAEAPIFWLPDAKSDSLEKTLMLGKIEGKRRREEQKMRQLDSIIDNRHEPEQNPGGGEGQGSLTCCSPWGCKGSDKTEHTWACTVVILLWGVFWYAKIYSFNIKVKDAHYKEAYTFRARQNKTVWD